MSRATLASSRHDRLLGLALATTVLSGCTAAWGLIEAVVLDESDDEQPPAPRELRDLELRWEGSDGVGRPIAKVSSPEASEREASDLDGECTFEIDVDPDGEPPYLEVSCEGISGLYEVSIEGLDDGRTELQRRNALSFFGIKYRGEGLVKDAGKLRIADCLKPQPMLKIDRTLTIRAGGFDAATGVLDSVPVGKPVDQWLREANGPPRSADWNAGNGKTALLTHWGRRVVLGDGETLDDLDWLINTTPVDTDRKKKCRVSGLGKFSLVAKDAAVKILDFRTGETVAEEVLENKGALRCSSILSRNVGDDVIPEPVSMKVVEKWAKRHLKASK
ncbi:MAG: hypothetical protein ACRBN8_15575 [Nannocystales bacterium]